MTRPRTPDEAVHDDDALLTDYLDDALSPAQRAAVRQRLDADPAFATALAEAEAARALLGGLPAVEVPLDFARGARRRLRRKRGFRSRGAAAMGFRVEVFAVMAAAAMFAVYLFLEVERTRSLGPVVEVPEVTHGP
jgi:anti-sigma factor RsiW